MSKKLERRRRLFNKFSNQLHLMVEEGILQAELQYDRTYICPICLNQFQENDLVAQDDTNFLTEEDAPPSKLQGSRIALTCKDCNSSAGYQIDNHLINRIREIDDANFHTGSKQYRKLSYDGGAVTAEITSNGDGTLTVLHRIGKNNPNLLDKFIYSLRNKTLGPILDLEPKNYKVIPERVNIALAKTNYIITFSKFGYLFLLHPFYNDLRRAIQNPESGSFHHLFLQNQFERNSIGTYFVTNPHAKAFFNIFSLKSNYSETLIGALLPTPSNSPQQLHTSLTQGGYDLGQEGLVGVSLQTQTIDPEDDLFTNVDDMIKIVRWTLG